MEDLALLWLFLGQFASVFFMVLNSKLLRDDKWMLAMANSFLITFSQLIFVEIVANSDFTMLILLLVGGLGGSLGCGFSHWVYTRLLQEKENKYAKITE